MAKNELYQEVPDNVAQAAAQLGCLGGVNFVYQEGQYGPTGRPRASIGCSQATRFRSTNYEKFKVSLGQGWVAFCSPSHSSGVLPQPTGIAGPDKDEEAVEEAESEEGAEAEAADVGTRPEAAHRSAVVSSSALAEVLNLINSPKYNPDDDTSLPISQVEQSIDALVKEFIEHPYLHRVEHSLHAQLFYIMVSQHPQLAERLPVGSSSLMTQLVHKEWPETRRREGKDRGNFDLAVLSRKLLETCSNIDTFRRGRVPAPIVIEIGLDYKAEHLAGDVLKLVNSGPKHGYLIHFVRERPREPEVEQIILAGESRLGIKTAYVSWTTNEIVAKGVNEEQITPRTIGGANPVGN